jgi:outer membrane protein, heavy metal efflux system
MARKITFLFVLFFIDTYSLAAQPAAVTLSLGLCDSLFVKNNLLLLASQFNLDAQTAAVIQAKLWENPYATAELNAIDPENNMYFHTGKDGQKAFSIQQLIYLGNKKHNEIELAKADAGIAALEYLDLLRELRYQLRSSYFSIYYDNLTLGFLDFQISNLDTLVNAYSVQTNNGNIPLKDLVRLQSLYFTLKNNRSDLFNNITNEQQKLTLITGSDSIIVPSPTLAELRLYDHTLRLNIDSLTSIALSDRPDLKIASADISAAQWNLRWQKSQVVPDLSLGLSYDQRSGAFQNQVDLTLGIPLIFWNRNQGNIRIAADNVAGENVLQEQKKLEITSQVYSAYERYLDAVKNARLINKGTYENFETVYTGVFGNFEKRNLSLLEFTDFIESYNESINQSNQFKKALITVSEELNYVTGSNLF